jgi:hypothetical protein
MLAVLTPLFDTNDVSGVHISSAGEEKLCEIFSKYLTALPGESEFPVTPQHDKKRNLSDITISSSSAEAKQSGIANDVWHPKQINSYQCLVNLCLCIYVLFILTIFQET